MTIRIEITAESPAEYRLWLHSLMGSSWRSKEPVEAAAAHPDEGGPAAPVDPAPSGQWVQGFVAGEPVDPAQHSDLAGLENLRDLEPNPNAQPKPGKRGRPSKAEIEAARLANAPAPLAEQTVTRAISDTPEDRAPEIVDPKPDPVADAVLSHDDIRAVLKTVVTAKGMPFATEQLTKLGFGKVSDVPAEKIAGVIEQLKVAAA